MNDRFHNNSDATQSARNGFIVVPSDTKDISTRQLHVLTDGDLAVVFAGYNDEDKKPDNADVVTIEVKAGQVFPWAVRRILETTTAGILAVY